jgi:hypothetical protein
MLDTTIITGKVYTGQASASNSVSKRLYVKVFPGEFWHRPPRAKKAKVYGGELFVRYSGREWPEKKNGTLLGDEGLLASLGDLLRGVNLVNVEELSYAKTQHKLKEVITLSVGPNLAKEIVDRGWARLNQDPENTVTKALLKIQVEEPEDLEEKSSVTTIGEAVMLPVETPEPVVEAVVTKKKSAPPKKTVTKEPVVGNPAPKAEPKKKTSPAKKNPA